MVRAFAKPPAFVGGAGGVAITSEERKRIFSCREPLQGILRDGHFLLRGPAPEDFDRPIQSFACPALARQTVAFPTHLDYRARFRVDLNRGHPMEARALTATYAQRPDRTAAL